jgi:hypothetical protein
MMNAGSHASHDYTFTQDKDKIARIRANMAAGKEREALPRLEREYLDVMVQQPTRAHILQLRANIGLDQKKE